MPEMSDDLYIKSQLRAIRSEQRTLDLFSRYKKDETN